MPENISLTQQELNQLNQLASEKANQQDYENCYNYLRIQSESTQLNYVLNAVRAIQETNIAEVTNPSSTRFQQLSTIPIGSGNGKEDAVIWNQVQNETQNAQTLAVQIGQLQTALQNQNPEQTFQALVSLSQTLTDKNAGISPELQRVVNPNIKNMLVPPTGSSESNTSQDSLEHILFQELLANTAASLQAQGKSTEDIKQVGTQIILNQIEKTNLTFFPNAANQLAGSSLLDSIASNPSQTSQNLQNTFTKGPFMSILSSPALQQKLSQVQTTLLDATTEEGQLKSYTSAVSAYWSGQYVKEGFTDQIATSITGLKNLVNVLAKAVPAYSGQLKSLASQLQTLENKFPTDWQDSDSQLLDKIGQQYSQIKTDIVENDPLPFKTLESIPPAESQLLQALSNRNQSGMSRLQALSSQIQDRLQMLDSSTRSLSNIANVLDVAQQGGQPTAWEVQTMVSSVNNLVNLYSGMTPDEKGAVDEAFNQLASVTNVRGQNLGQVLGEAQVAQWTQQYAQKNTPTIAGLKQWLNKQINTFEQSPMDNNLYKNMQETMRLPNFAQLKTSSGIPYAQGTGDSFSLSTNFWEMMMAENFFALSSGGSTTTPQEAVHKALTAHKKSSAHHQGHSQAIANAYTAHTNAQASTNAAGATSSIQDQMNKSLMSMLSYALLEVFMPQQEQFVMSLASTLSYQNTGASMMNTLLNDLTGWDSGSVNFGTGNYLNAHSQGNGVYGGTVSQVNNQINNEKNAISNAQNQLNQALNDISKESAQLAQLLKSGKITYSQYSNIESKLTSASLQLLSIKAQLSAVKNDLNGLTVTAGTAPNTVNIGGTSLTQLSEDESNLSNAMSNLVQGTLGNAQQTFSGQSQNSQVGMQAAMTNLQMGTQTTTTCLSNTNQMVGILTQNMNPTG